MQKSILHLKMLQQLKMLKVKLLLPRITSKNISQTIIQKIIVKVTDKYGYTKTAELPLTIASWVNNQ